MLSAADKVFFKAVSAKFHGFYLVNSILDKENSKSDSPTFVLKIDFPVVAEILTSKFVSIVVIRARFPSFVTEYSPAKKSFPGTLIDIFFSEIFISAPSTCDIKC